ncbi:unnamed protein product [Pseudo-nitzschia multistriata]|uniref:Uncharacterized protein n=1 Tax=Pseudo-nitzschia multistriata TaxID=183589 RepID=A0A448ZRE8_9STRA|nr:unnamed protein product [Pseudo-nitzschia multistriata]
MHCNISEVFPSVESAWQYKKTLLLVLLSIMNIRDSLGFPGRNAFFQLDVSNWQPPLLQLSLLECRIVDEIASLLDVDSHRTVPLLMPVLGKRTR